MMEMLGVHCLHHLLQNKEDFLMQHLKRFLELRNLVL